MQLYSARGGPWLSGALDELVCWQWDNHVDWYDESMCRKKRRIDQDSFEKVKEAARAWLLANVEKILKI